MKDLIVYTPMNPTRPFYDKLTEIHHYNLDQQDRSLFDYDEEEVLLHPNLQKEGLWRGQNIIEHFNRFYEGFRDSYKYICKWDDDIVLPRDTISLCLKILDSNSRIVGCGLFQEDYGAPNILMVDQVKNGWYGAFSRFYVYRMNVWGTIPVECPWLHGENPSTVRGEHSGDPDNSFQIAIQGEKKILGTPYIHLDHRVFKPENKYMDYEILLNLTLFFLHLYV